jgi:putative adenylate-forming enzyme
MKKRLVILWHFLKTRWMQQRFSSRQSLEIWQEKQVQKLLKQVLQGSKFYRRHFGTLQLHQWRQIDCVSKNELMKHFDDWNTAGISLEQALQLATHAEASRDFSPMIGDIAVGLSSGTSGNRGMFLVSQAERQAWAGALIAKILPDCWKQSERIALFLRADNHLYQSLNQGGRLRFRYFDLMDSIERHIASLSQYKPTVLVGPPSLLRLLATAQAENRLTIQPQQVISVAEVLEPLDANWIQHVFGQKIHQVYQCTEGFLAATCRLGTLHLNEDILVIEKEYIDSQAGKFIPIITDFRRYTQPIIRYRLNDILTERKSSCPCGSIFTAIEGIEGRCDDLFYFKTIHSDKLVPIFPDFIRRAIILSSPYISEYLVKQVSTERLEIALRLISEQQHLIQNAVSSALLELFRQHNCHPPNIQFVPCPTQPDSMKKLRRIQRDFELEGSYE